MVGTRYVVQDGDTLWELAHKFYSDSNKWPTILSHNNTEQIKSITKSSIPDEDVIFVGQVLYIPDANSPLANTANPIRYVHAKSKARQFAKYKDSIFLKGVELPPTRIPISEISNYSPDSPKEKQLALRIKLARTTSNADVEKLLAKIDSVPELGGAGLTYVDQKFTVVQVRKSRRQDNVVVLLREMRSEEFIGDLSSPTAGQRLFKELALVGLSCSAAALGYVAIAGEGLATPFTAGGTSVLIPVTIAATLASSASCGVYVGRVTNEAVGNSSYNDYLDDSRTFNVVMTTLDVVSLLGVAAAAKEAVHLVKLFKNKNMTRQSLLQQWKAMPRRDRKILLKELVKLEARPTNQKELKLILRAMDVPKVFSQVQVRNAMFTQLIDVIGATFSTTSSAADGTIKKIAIAILADTPNE